jgi:hypothetical protein
MQLHFEWMLAFILFLWSGHALQAQNSAENVDSKSLISTGVTGSISASGLDDPQYVLTFLPVQRLMLEASHHPLSDTDICDRRGASVVAITVAADALRHFHSSVT